MARNSEEVLATHFFSHLDLDKDGVISRQDLHQTLSNLSITPTSHLIDRIHEDLDFNQDGRINYRDFFNFLKAKHPKTFENTEILTKISQNPEIPLKIHIVQVFDYWTKASSIDLGESMVIPDEIVPEKTGTSSWIIFVSGGFAGALSRTFTAPLDRIKVIFQANLGKTARKSSGKSENKILKEMHAIYEENGWRGFFRGNGTNVIKIVPETGVKFLAYEQFKRVFCQDYHSPRASERLLSGGLAGVCSQLVVYPLEITKTRLALAPTGVYNGILDCIEKIYRSEGAFGLYKGLQASLIGVIPYASIDLAIYNTLRDRYIKKNSKDPRPLILLMCGAISSICGQLVSYPFAVIRTRLQSQGMPGINMHKYEGLWDCAKKIEKFEGVKGFYRGIVPNFMKTVPAISISYVVFENVKKKLTEKRNKYYKMR